MNHRSNEDCEHDYNTGIPLPMPLVDDRGEVVRLREALEFYADPNSYIIVPGMIGTGWRMIPPPAAFDGGKKAREALGKQEEQTQP